MKNFSELALPPALIQSLIKMDYNVPTPIQAQTIPLALEGRDVLGSAQTGTGKTAAFSIPVISKLMQSPRGSALIMLPTRELAAQVVEVVKKMLGSNNPIKTALLIGGEAMHPQFKQLQMRPRIIVGTPGRINDHLERGSLKLHDAGILVLDETDRMLDMGFGIQIDKILKFVPKVRQTLLFSATMPKNIMSMASKYLTNPERVEVGSNNTPMANIKQEIINTTDVEKYNILIEQLKARAGTIIIFVKTKRGADKLSMKLNREGHSADTIHGDLPQKKRDRVIKAFREKQHRIMVATDVAARGLDIPHIEHVINYDLPMQPEDYIHRIGRTARNGELGSALCLVTPEDRIKMNAINRLIDPNFKAAPRAEGENRTRGAFGDKKRFGGKPGGFSKGRSSGGGYKGRSGNRDSESAPREPRAEGEFRRGGDRDSKPRTFNNAGGERRDFGSKPKSFGDKPKSFGGERRESFGDKPKSFGDKPKSFGGERRDFGDKPKSFGDKPKTYGKPQGENRGEARGENKPSGNREFRGSNGFGGKKRFGGKPSGGRKFGGGSSAPKEAA